MERCLFVALKDSRVSHFVGCEWGSGARYDMEKERYIMCVSVQQTDCRILDMGNIYSTQRQWWACSVQGILGILS